MGDKESGINAPFLTSHPTKCLQQKKKKGAGKDCSLWKSPFTLALRPGNLGTLPHRVLWKSQEVLWNSPLGVSLAAGTKTDPLIPFWGLP